MTWTGLTLVAYASTNHLFRSQNACSSFNYSIRSHVRILWNSQEIRTSSHYNDLFQFNQASDLNPHGFKIALDLLLKSPLPIQGVTEVPFSFGTRKEGESKLTGKVMLRYLEQLGELYWWKYAGLIIMLLVMFIVGFILVALQIYVNGGDKLRLMNIL